MVDVLGALRNAGLTLRDAARRLRAKARLLSIPERVEPELEARVRRLFGELKNTPLVQPSHDLAQEVTARLRRLNQDRAPPASDDRPRGDGP